MAATTTKKTDRAGRGLASAKDKVLPSMDKVNKMIDARRQSLLAPKPVGEPNKIVAKAVPAAAAFAATQIAKMLWKRQSSQKRVPSAKDGDSGIFELLVFTVVSGVLSASASWLSARGIAFLAKHGHLLKQ